MLFSPSVGGFFDPDINPSNQIPSDAVTITTDQYHAMLAAQASGGTFLDALSNAPQIEPDPPSIGELRAAVVSKIKAEADRRIQAAVPVWQQINDLADTLLARDGALNGLRARRATIDAIRDRSNALEASVATMTSEQLAAFNPRSDAAWSS